MTFSLTLSSRPSTSTSGRQRQPGSSPRRISAETGYSYSDWSARTRAIWLLQSCYMDCGLTMARKGGLWEIRTVTGIRSGLVTGTPLYGYLRTSYDAGLKKGMQPKESERNYNCVFNTLTSSSLYRGNVVNKYQLRIMGLLSYKNITVSSIL